MFLDNETYSYGGITLKGLSRACTYSDYFMYWRNKLFERLMRLFIYDGLGDEIEAKEIEERLYMLGHCGVTEYEGKLTAFFGDFYGPTVYQDEFTHYTVHSPIFSNTFKIDDDIIVIENNALKNPALDHVNHYAQLLAHAEVTLIKQLVEARDSGGVPIAQNEKVKQSILNYQKSMFEGKINVISDLAGIGVEYQGADRHTSIDLNATWDVRTKLIKSFYADIGVRASFDKKSNTVVDEITSDTSMLLYNISDMLEARKKGLDKINKKWGRNWTVRISDEIDYNIENQPEELTGQKGAEDDTDD